MYQQKNPKNQNFEKEKVKKKKEKRKNCLEILIRSDRQKFLLFWATFLPFQPPDKPENQNFKIEKNSWIYYHFTHLHYKWQWFLRYGVWQTEFFIILDFCLPFYPTNKLKNQNFEKLKKAPEDIIILHKCARNHDHMLYCSCDMVCDR